jgi:hypothetical protein
LAKGRLAEIGGCLHDGSSHQFFIVHDTATNTWIKVMIPDAVFKQMLVAWEVPLLLASAPPMKNAMVQMDNAGPMALAMSDEAAKPTRALRSLVGSFDPGYEGEGYYALCLW